MTGTFQKFSGKNTFFPHTRPARTNPSRNPDTYINTHTHIRTHTHTLELLRTELSLLLSLSLRNTHTHTCTHTHTHTHTTFIHVGLQGCTTKNTNGHRGETQRICPINALVLLTSINAPVTNIYKCTRY